ncbi:MAG: acyltransferase [Hyphomicrobiales bacterium]|nr:MAG: acyltransferase [Hyphomicrobiales bacterium]
MRRECARFAYLDLLRFALSLAVLVYHFFYFGPRCGVLPADGALDVPALALFLFAVEAFFILSGFVIVLSAANRDPLDFAIARLTRLGPCLLVCGSITFICLTLWPYPPTPGVGFKSYIATILVVPLVRYGGVDWSLWSLKYELLFYGLVFLGLCGRSVIPIGPRSAITLMLAAEGATLAARILAQSHSFQFGSYFIAGVVLYAARTRRMSWPSMGPLLVILFPMLAIESWWEINRVNRMLGLPEWSAWSGAWIAAGLIALVGVSVLSDGARLGYPARSLIQKLGRVSYPLYVLHQLFGYWLINRMAASVPLWQAQVITSLIVVGMAWWIAMVLEPPLQRGYRKCGFVLVAFLRRALPEGRRIARGGSLSYRAASASAAVPAQPGGRAG